MAIRLNLLSEAQALEDLRRKDPVKRVLWAGILFVVALLVWSSSLQVRAIVAKGELSRVDGRIAALTNSFNEAVTAQKQLTDITRKLAALRQLATNRFLQAPVLNAMQEALIADVQLTRLRTEQAYVCIEPTKAGTNALKQVMGGSPGKSIEKIAIYLDGRDTAANAGDQVTRYKQAVASNVLFQNLLGRTNEVKLASLAPPAPGAGKPYVAFSLECKLPERTR